MDSTYILKGQHIYIFTQYQKQFCEEESKFMKLFDKSFKFIKTSVMII